MKLGYFLVFSVFFGQSIFAMPVEDIVTENGTWANFAQIVNTVTNTAHQVAQGYSMISMTEQELKNFNLKNINNMSDMFSKMQDASEVGNSIVYTSSSGIDKINDWTRDQDDPKGRLNGLTSLMDTAKATIKVSGEQAKYMSMEASDVGNINAASNEVSGETEAVMAGNQLMTHLNTQVQSVNTTLAQQNTLEATEAAERSAKEQAVAGHENVIASTLKNIGSDAYTGEEVPTGSY